MRFTRAKFEELNMDAFDKCIKTVETCLSDANMKKSCVNEVILVGGSTRRPKVQCILQEFFDGKQLCQSINPDEAVAYGAAIMAAKLCGDSTAKLLKDLVLMDVTPLSIGTMLHGDIMEVVIPRNTLIPTKKTATFFTTEDNQSAITTKIYQGERTRATKNYLLGEFRISGIPLAPKGVTKVEETYEIDANGILTVTTKEVSTGRSKKLTVTNHSGRLSKQEIKKMINDAEKFKIEDQEYKRKVDAYNALEDCLYDLKKKMKAHDIITKLDPKALKNINYAIADTTEWLSNNKTATVDEVEAKKEYLEFVSGLAFSN